MQDYSIFPAIDATLNGASAALITMGVALIRRGRQGAHRACMIAAVVTSSLFLCSYLYYHAHVGTTRFLAHGWIRPVYFSVLLTHTILAAAIVPLVIVTLSRALRGRFDRHRAIARWTYPAWLYVSVTGVVIYLLLYRLTPLTAVAGTAAVVITIAALLVMRPRADRHITRSPDHQIVKVES
ncbi:MAG TPA: DUF420 domain-containing protein [Terriglobales bacterium]|nr:DUF420 domain-containing protein [Terriglobales bacterium]